MTHLTIKTLEKGGTKRLMLCWCNSGKKFIDCHSGRESISRPSSSEIRHNIRKYQQLKECLHPDIGNDSCNRIINAHTVQKSGPLKKIINCSNHVMYFNMLGEIEQIGHKEASTFTGFCGKHDNEFFEPIEGEAFGTDHTAQCFLHGYRAYALELHKKKTALSALEYMRNNLDKGKPLEEQQHIQNNVITPLKDGYEKGLESLKRTLGIYKKAYRENQYEDFEYAIFTFNGNLSIVSSGAFAPGFTTGGNRIQVLNAGINIVKNIALSTTLTSSGHAIVFSWPSKFTECRKFIDSLLTVPERNLSGYIISIFFLYIENTYFNIDWWDKLNSYYKDSIINMVNSTTWNDRPLVLNNYTYSNWKFTKSIISY